MNRLTALRTGINLLKAKFFVILLYKNIMIRFIVFKFKLPSGKARKAFNNLQRTYQDLLIKAVLWVLL